MCVAFSTESSSSLNILLWLVIHRLIARWLTGAAVAAGTTNEIEPGMTVRGLTVAQKGGSGRTSAGGCSVQVVAVRALFQAVVGGTVAAA